MTSNCSKVTVAALIAALSQVVGYTEDAPKNPTAASATAEKKSPSFLRLDGTDLLIGDLPPITFHGFGSQGFISSDTYNFLGKSKDGSFEFTEAAVNASMSPFARTRISAQGFLFDVGNVGRWQPGLDYAVVDYSLRDEIGFRVGRIRRPEGIYNSTQDIDLARTSVLLPQGMYDAKYRDFSASVDGGSIYGNVGMGKAGSLSYELYGGVIDLSEKGGVARLLQDSVGPAYTGVNGFSMAGFQTWWATPIEGLRAGLAFSEAFHFSYDVAGGYVHDVIDSPVEHISLEYQVKAWTFQAEYKYTVYDTTPYRGGVEGAKSNSETDTWYVGAAYRFNKWFELGSYYTEFYADVSNRSGTGRTGAQGVPSDGYQKDFALSLRFDPKPWWIIKAEVHRIHGTGMLHQNQDNPVRDNDGWYMIALKTTVSF